MVPGVWVRGTIVSTGLGMFETVQRVTARLEAAGWLVQSFNLDTDSGFIPLPRSRTMNVQLHRTRPYSTAEAAAALVAATGAEGWSLELIGDYASEVVREVVEPTVKDLKKLSSWAVPAVLVVAGLGALAYVLTQVRALTGR